MKKTVVMLAAAGSLVALAGPAMAQDAVPFSGLRVGVEAGYDRQRSGSTVDLDTDSDDVKQSIDGIHYGAVVGYDFPLGTNLRLGAEASYAGSTAGWDNDERPNTFTLGQVESDRTMYAGARLGYVMSPKTMLYVKGGYANQRFSGVGRDDDGVYDAKLDTDGWRVGAGVEAQVAPGLYLGAEYRYTKYEEAEFDFEGDAPDTARFDIDTDQHQVVATAGVRF